MYKSDLLTIWPFVTKYIMWLISQEFQVGFWCCKKQIWSTHWVDWDGNLKNEDDLKNKVDLKSEDDLKNEDHLKYEDNLKNKDNLKNEEEEWKIPLTFFFWNRPLASEGMRSLLEERLLPMYFNFNMRVRNKQQVLIFEKTAVRYCLVRRIRGESSFLLAIT